ncbi:MAG: choice-of-anchor D domain-containing protein, partial [Prosthecobacter sp.]
MKARLRTALLPLIALLALPAAAQVPYTLRHPIPAPPGGAQALAELGSSVAVDGDYTVVGAPLDDIGGQNAGVVKVFHSTTGTLLFLLPNPSPALNDQFGYSVAISGTRVVVGANLDDTGATDAGSAYVYDLASGTPTVPVHTLNKPSPAAGEAFGISVAILGTRVVVGADKDDTGATDAGSVHVYDLGSGTPTVPVLTLNNPAPAAGAFFGNAVALGGTRLVVGAPQSGGSSGSGDVYAYDLSSGTPSVPVATLPAPAPTIGSVYGFGRSVGISGTRIIVGAPYANEGNLRTGNVYAYDLSSGTPTVPVLSLFESPRTRNSFFGNGVAITGTRLIVGALGTTKTYVYDVTSGTPAVPAHTLNTPAASDNFGYAVAISGTRVAVGAPSDDTEATNAGRAYGYDLSSGTPTVPVATYDDPSPASGDTFGRSVAVSGTLMVVGAPLADIGANDAGIAHVYDFSSGTPTVPVATLNNPVPVSNDQFGYTVAISGTRVAVGRFKSSGGSVNIYDLSGVTPTVPTHTLSSPTTSDEYGTTVVISGARVAVGAPRDDTGGIDKGSVYVYDLSSGTPTVPVTTLNKPASTSGYAFGSALAISGTQLVVGGGINADSAHVYDLTSGTPTVPITTLNGSGQFGASVAISGIRVVVGATYGGTSSAGRVLVYDLSSGTPTVPVTTLNNPTPAADDQFGNSVAISGTRLVVGAFQDDDGATDSGRAYVYDLGSGTPTVPVATISNPGPAAGDKFGNSVAVDGATVAIGAPYDDSAMPDKGYAYVFGPAAPTVTLNTTGLPTTLTTLTITGTGFDSTPGNNTVALTPAGTGTVTAATATSLTVTGLSGVSLGALSAVVTTSGQNSGVPVQVATVVVATPEIAVTGKGVDIPQGDTTTSTADGTHFGNVALLNARVAHNFNISNEGDSALNLSGSPLVSLSGPGAAAFEVTLAPADTVAAGGSTTFAITFDPSLPGSYTATVTIQSDAVNHPSFTFNISGFGVLSMLRTQTITFVPPATVYLSQSPLSLNAYASSGMLVTLSVVPVGTTAAGASIVGNVLSFTGTGTIKVQAVQPGGSNYAAATTVVKTITVKANLTALTLLNLAQTYTGTARPISTLGGTGAVTIEYKLGTTILPGPPTAAGSYSVKATDSSGTSAGIKTGTLVISKAPLYVTPADQSKFVGKDNPPLTLSYSGFVSGETASLVTTAPALKTTATKTSVGGEYPITASGGVVSANYVFIYLQGALVVHSFATSYEALLASGGGNLVGKLAITIVAANTGFTGKLYCKDEKTALSLNGTLVSTPGSQSATGSASVTSSLIPYVVNVTVKIDGSLSASVTRSGGAYASSNEGRRVLTLATGKTVAYAGAHTAVLEPATPSASGVPAGAGWATAVISTNGVMTLTGRLGDGTAFTTSLTPDDAADPTYRLFVHPYVAARAQSYIGGAITLLPHPSVSPALAGRRYVESAVMSWAKAGLIADASYRTGFGPVSSVMMLDPWLPPAAA